LSEKRVRGNSRELSWESTKGNQFGARRTIHLLLFEAEKKTRLGELFCINNYMIVLILFTAVLCTNICILAI